jgi:ribosome recycling factor
MSFDINAKLKDIEAWLVKEYSGIRTGQANPSLLDGVKVESYGSLVPLNQVGSVSVEDARTIRLSVWDSSQVATVEKSIRDADLGVSVVTDSSGLRIIFPELTSERRTQLQKLAKTKLEEARVSVRGVRDEILKELEKGFKSGEVSEDEKFSVKETVQKQVDSSNNSLESLYDKKEKELSF